MSASALKKSIFVRNAVSINALVPGYLKGTVVRGHPIVVWSLALCLDDDDAKQDPVVVYGAEFGVE